eukprot:TRINITY_DN4074_c1_g7_i1.p1 TRINITY_DN4074_c1_g7~~TRINITY_DN4074_c1_g7_i1.p1  ORF type:complete len:360 (+),score=45.61 TRINITY_DN4074_c1_g7_i1:104-1183(+)
MPLDTDASRTTLSADSFVEYRPSVAWPVVLSAPHGGDLLPDSIPDRTSGCFEPDWSSSELADSVWEAFKRGAGDPPALVKLNLHRKKIDANRSRAASCEPDAEEALKAWDDYHGSLAEALQACVERFGFCLLLDIHGQSHRKGVTELGYLLTSDDLLLSDGQISTAPPRPSSIDGFLRCNFSSCNCQASEKSQMNSSDRPDRDDLAGLVRGPKSLGGLLGQHGIPCTPSPDIPEPVTSDAIAAAKASKLDVKALTGPPEEAARAATYFWGGYSARRYGAPDTVPAHCNPLPPSDEAPWVKKVAAVQLETSWTGARENADARAHFAQSLHSAVVVLLETWAGWSSSTQSTRKRKASSDEP